MGGGEETFSWKNIYPCVGTGKFSSRDLLDNLGTSIIVSDRLTFLGKYRQACHKKYYVI